MLRESEKPLPTVARSGKKPTSGRWWVAFLMVLPFTLVYLTFLIYPSVRVLQLSFTNSDIAGVGHYIGLENYARLIKDPNFWNCLLAPGPTIARSVASNGAHRRRSRNVLVRNFDSFCCAPTSVALQGCLQPPRHGRIGERGPVRITSGHQTAPKCCALGSNN